MYAEHIEKNLLSINSLPKKENIKNIIDKFVKHNRVIFCTMGKSAFACRKVVYTARSYGLEWHDLDVCHAFHGDAGIVRDGDLLVFVSKSGKTKETIEVANYFSNWDTISVTSDKNSPLSVVCKENIYIPIVEEGSPFGYAPMISTSMYMIVLHGILSEVVDAKNIKIEEYARNHPAGNIGDKLRKFYKESSDK